MLQNKMDPLEENSYSYPCSISQKYLFSNKHVIEVIGNVTLTKQE